MLFSQLDLWLLLFPLLCPPSPLLSVSLSILLVSSWLFSNLFFFLTQLFSPRSLLPEKREGGPPFLIQSLFLSMYMEHART